MNATQETAIHQRLALIGEHLISLMDELKRLPCPKCGYTNLVGVFIDGNIVVQCSPNLVEWNDLKVTEDMPDLVKDLCRFIHTVKPTNLGEAPFTFNFANKKPTKKNVARTRRRKTYGE